MNRTEPDYDHSNNDDHQVDQLVTAYLEAKAQDVPCEELAERILRTSGLDSVRETTNYVVREKVSIEPKRVFTLRKSWLLVTAAAVVIAFTFGRWETFAYASAANLVKAAQSVHAMALERCYVVRTMRVTNKGAGNPDDVSEEISKWSNIRIWTQGNRFWVDIQNSKRAWAWGRNQEGTVWLTLGRNRGLQLRADEMGSTLEQICDLHSLEVESLLENFQTKWTLTRGQATESSYTVIAQPKRGGFHGISKATIEIDRETKAIRQLLLNRTLSNGSQVQASFTLVETRTPVEELYQPEGHLEEPFQILSRENLGNQRRDVIKHWFGPTAAQWIR
jgi:hypothetical protein